MSALAWISILLGYLFLGAIFAQLVDEDHSWVFVLVLLTWPLAWVVGLGIRVAKRVKR